MQSFSRTPWALGLALIIALVSFQSVTGQEKSEDIHFITADSVKIVGTYWPSKAGNNAPVALLLHEFHRGKGGNRSGAGWISLAAALNAKGYAVLTFDFRGHGDSTALDKPMEFWSFKFPQNKAGIGVAVNPVKPPESIAQGTFRPTYFPMLVNDVVAAKAYLDRKNDKGELNASNLVVIGAGEGATIGSLWLASEFHRKRGVPLPQAQQTVDPRLIRWDNHFEGEDVRAAVWIGISPSLADQNVLPLKGWLTEYAKTNKVPTAFVYGKEDPVASERALIYLRTIIRNYDRDPKIFKENPLPGTGEKPVASKLKASELLTKPLDTEDWIVNVHLSGDEIKKNLKEEWKKRDSETGNYYWVFGANPALPPQFAVTAKDGPNLMNVPLVRFGLGN